MGTPVKPFLIMKDCDRHKSGQNKQLDASSDIVVANDADEPINANKLPNAHHSTEAESVEMNNLETGIDPLQSNHNLDGIPHQLAKLEHAWWNSNLEPRGGTLSTK